MKQVYAAGLLTPGTSPAFRAASRGLRPDEVQTALSFANYAPPPSRASDADHPLPVRLALLNSTDGRVLTHITPNGSTYFAHALWNVPATADAQLAIQTWGSPLWQRHDAECAADLPELPYLPVADVLDDAALRSWLAAEAHRELLGFALTALLETDAATRVFLAASAEDVAAVVYAVTRALPAGLLDEFTFSTYESAPLTCSARLIGHDAGDWDLPEACYTEGVGFNPAKGRRSELPGASPFAAFAVRALAASDYDALDEVRATWQRLGLRDARQFELVFRLSHGEALPTKAEAADALQHPPLAAWLAARPEALDQFLDWALDDRGFANGSFSRAVQALRQKADVLGKLGQTVRERGLAALKAGDETRTANALEVVLPMVAPARANAVWGELLAQLAEPDELPWEMRCYLLPRFARFKQQSGVDAALGKWLNVPAERLAELLALELPRGYQLAAGRACLKRDGEPSATLTHTLARHPVLTLALLQPGDGGSDDRAVALFESLLAEAPEHPWFEELLAKAVDYPAGLRNRFFESALSAGKVDADRVIRTQGSRLLELFAGQSGLTRIGTQFLADPPADLLRNSDVLEFLTKLRDEPHAGDDLKQRVAAVRAVRDYLDEPAFTPEAMRPTADALTLTPPVLPTGTKGAVFTAIAEEFRRRADDVTLQADLEAVLLHFGGVLANDPTDLYENLLRELRGRTDFGKHANLVETFLAVALGAAHAPELAKSLDGLDGHAFAVAHDAAQRGGHRLLRDIDRRAEMWPKAARTQWGFLRAAVQPPSFRRAARDGGLVLLGGAAAVAVTWVARLLP
jgi:hypothetical protein